MRSFYPLNSPGRDSPGQRLRRAGAALLLLVAFSAAAQAQLTNIQYTTTTSNGQVTITGFSATGSGPLVIPGTIDGLPVTSIGADSNGVGAFQASASLTGITIPSSVTSFGEDAFYGCTSLASVTIPNNVTSIGDYAFYGCTGLTTLAIPAGVTCIGEDAFANCTGLTCATIPASVTRIGVGAFAGCAGLTGIALPASITSIGPGVFGFCASLASVTIPAGVTSIGEGAFDGCASLTGMTIPSSVSSIADDAFLGCTGLTSVVFNGNAPTMGTGVFNSAAGGFTVSYYNGATGFASPTWVDSSGDSWAAVNLGTYQTISFPAISGQDYPGPTVALSATASSGLSVSYSVVSGPATVSGNTLTLTGTGTVTVQASQTGDGTYASAVNMTQSFTVAAAPSTFGQWETAYNITSAATAAPLNDGVPNLLKYLYDINPTVPMTATDRAALPIVGTTTAGGTQYLTLTYRQYIAATGITVNVQTSPDLQTWTTLTETTTTPTATTYTLQQAGTDSTTGDPMMQVQVPFGGTREFIRLNVTSP